MLDNLRQLGEEVPSQRDPKQRELDAKTLRSRSTAWHKKGQKKGQAQADQLEPDP